MLQQEEETRSTERPDSRPSHSALPPCSVVTQTLELRPFPGSPWCYPERSLPHFFLLGQVYWRPVSHVPTQQRLTDREVCLLPWPSPLL